MCEDPLYHGVQGALLLEDNPGQVQEDLVALDLQQTPLVDLGVPQAQAAELEILLKNLAVVVAEVSVIVLVDNLKMFTWLMHFNILCNQKYR